MRTVDQQRRLASLRIQPLRRWVVVGSLGAIVVIAAACGSASSSPTSVVKQRPASSHTTQPVVQAAQVGALGMVLVDQSGFTLYRFAPDGTGKTTCTGACATAWPPLMVTSAHVTGGPGITSSELGTITRPDGTLQVTFNGMALYRFSGDKKAGDATGQGVAGVWSVVAASAAAATPPSTSTSSPPPSSTSSSTPAATNHSTGPGMGSGPQSPPPSAAVTAPPATAPPATAPPMTSPPVTSPPATSPPTTSGGGYGY